MFLPLEGSCFNWFKSICSHLQPLGSSSGEWGVTILHMASHISNVYNVHVLRCAGWVRLHIETLLIFVASIVRWTSHSEALLSLFDTCSDPEFAKWCHNPFWRCLSFSSRVATPYAFLMVVHNLLHYTCNSSPWLLYFGAQACLKWSQTAWAKQCRQQESHNWSRVNARTDMRRWHGAWFEINESLVLQP